MRQYLYLFWGLVLAGMIILTAAYPECRQAASFPYPVNRDFAVYNQNGDRWLVKGGDPAADMSATGNRAGQSRF
jgi:hypothetical protein